MTAAETRTFTTTLELRETETTGRRPYRYLEGRAVPYDQWADVGPFVERHAQDSFKKSTNGGSGKNAPLLPFHDNRTRPLGRAVKWRHDDGLYGVWELADTAEAQSLAEAANAGELVGLSIGFMDAATPAWDFRGWDDWDPALGPDHKDRVTRLESRLIEVSLTPTPAYAEAGVECVRTAYGIEVREAKVPRPALAIDAWRAWRAGLDSR